MSFSVITSSCFIYIYIYDFDQTEKRKFMNMLIVVGPSWRRNLLKIKVFSVHSAVVRNAIFIVGVSSAVHVQFM
jgi:hypothetical protein